MSKFKRNIQKEILITALFVVICFLIVGKVYASSVDTIQLLKISPQDQRAIIKTFDGKMQIIKPGDMVGDDKVVEITVGRVVFEEKTGSDTETVIIRLEGGDQRVERVKRVAEKQPQLYAVKNPHEQKAQSKAPEKNKSKKDKKQKPVNEFKKSSVVN